MDGAATPSAMLRLAGIAKSFGGTQVLRGVSLDVRAGECHLLIGPNGAGKTTLFNAATGQIRPSAGTIQFEGADITRLPPHRRARLGLARTFQIASLFRQLSVAQNLALASWAPAPYFGRRKREASDAQLEQLLGPAGLTNKRNVRVGELAYGEQRQLEIALALALRPRMLLMDEPMAGLSPEERRALIKRIAGLGGAMPILMIDHNLDDALAVAQRVTVMHLGEVVCRGTPAEIRRDPIVRQVYLG
jgi:branched-chain amino acid transport system ATP-binding protein